jgi:stearoyl-CoA desaturase (Delta-9 desaturase)
MTMQFEGAISGESAKTTSPKGRTIVSDYIKKQQLNHFLLYNVVPFVLCILAIASLWWLPISGIEISLMILFWAVTMTGVSVGFHRYFTHRAFKTNPALHTIFAILGSMAAQGPLISWVAVHRRHHECSDESGDPHSPNLHGQGILASIKGLWHSHIGWLIDHEYPNPSFYCPELLRDPALSKINRQYIFWVVLGLIIPAILGGILHGSWIGALQGFLWGGVVRIVVVDNIILSVNSFSHMFGSHPFETGDLSKNNPWLFLPTFGESWQNNHHAFANSASIGLKWWQVDFGYWVIWLLEKVGLVWDVNLPSAVMLEAKKVA